VKGGRTRPRSIVFRIGETPAADAEEGSPLVTLAAGGAEDVLDRETVDDQRIGDQGTMAAPGHGLGTQEHAAFPRNKIFQPRQCDSEFRGLHIIGKAAEARIAPALVRRIETRVAQPAKLLHVKVADSPAAQVFCQGLAVELRIMARAGNRAHVYHARNAMSREQGVELLERTRRVADGQHRRLPRSALLQEAPHPRKPTAD
jgi:hypothetical protein